MCEKPGLYAYLYAKLRRMTNTNDLYTHSIATINIVTINVTLLLHLFINNSIYVLKEIVAEEQFALEESL